jgi:hypothetical protein
MRRDRVLAEHAIRADRARALVRDAFVAHPDPHVVPQGHLLALRLAGVWRAPALRRHHASAQLAAARLGVQHALLGEALLAALEGLTTHDHRDGLAVEDVRDAAHARKLARRTDAPPAAFCGRGSERDLVTRYFVDFYTPLAT